MGNSNNKPLSAYTEEIKKLYLKEKSSTKVASIISKKYKFPFNETLSRRIRKINAKSKIDKPKKIEEVKEDIFKKAVERKHKKSKYYIITSAQNATPIHKKLWSNIQTYSKKLNANIEVIPIRYKNPTSNFTELPQEWWADELQEYLIANRHSLNKRLTVIADLKTQPTNSSPLSGIEGLTGAESSIIGHPRQHLRYCPVLDVTKPKILFSTGSITEKNYTDSKSGAKGDFHHVYGFLIVEIKNDNTFFIRQVSANNDGSFYDLDYYVNGSKVEKRKDAVLAVVLGDEHVGQEDYECEKASKEMLERFKPKNVIVHDIMDGYSISHHHKKDPFILLDKEIKAQDNIKKEIEQVCTFIKTILKYNPIIVKSNHDIFIDRFILDNDWRKESNKADYLYYAYLQAKGELPNGILPYEIRQRFGNKVICLTETSSYKLNDIEIAIHGHLGANGSRGGANQFKKLNTRLVTGHTHSPLIEDGLYTVGANCKIRQGYNKGLSSQGHSNVLIHKNGKRQQILIFNGEYTTI